MSEGEQVDFSRIYRDYHGKVRSYAAKLIGRDDADDVTQDVFVKISRSLHTLTDRSRIGSWIYAITLNTVRDTVRRRGSRDARCTGPLLEGGGDAVVSRAPDPSTRTPEEAVARSEMVACYLDYVKQLPRGYYDVYVLSEFEHLANAEIARRLGLPVGTVKIRLHRARSRLHDELRRNCQCYYSASGELMGEPKKK